jgi:hypothetical protein
MAPTALSVLGEEVTASADGRIYKLVRYPEVNPANRRRAPLSGNGRSSSQDHPATHGAAGIGSIGPTPNALLGLAL